MKKIDRLIELLDIETRKWNYDRADRALYCLLKGYKDQLPELDGYFHKAFRQVDVTDNGCLDSAIWNLLNGSTLFWRLFEAVQEEKTA